MDAERHLFGERRTIRARALLVSERIELKSIEGTQRLTVTPMVLWVGERGCAVLFRYGAIVLFGLDPLEEVALISKAQPLLHQPFEEPQLEETEVTLEGRSPDAVAEGVIVLKDFSVERIQIVAEILAKAVALSHYEERLAEALDRVSPLALELQRRGRSRRGARELLRAIGDTLITQHNMVGRVEVTDKPELLWDLPSLERLYLRLEDEYEIRDRHLALERKLEVISQTLQTLLDLLQNRRAMRVEWYIVLLIFVAILLMLYQMIWGTGH